MVPKWRPHYKKGSIISITKSKKEAKTCLLYRGKEWIKEKDILCIPCEDFLEALVLGKPVPIS
jgi:hypothetical protein